jgi:outer membrane protein TolC
VNPKPTSAAIPRLWQRSLIATAALMLGACATVQIQPLQDQPLAEQTKSDAISARQGVEPITRPLILAEAVARALKYNLDYRVRRMEESLALGEIQKAEFDMLPRLMASAGYAWRDNDRISLSRNAEDGTLSPSRFVSSDRNRETLGLDFSWSLLDVGLGYYGARQQADRQLITLERRRKAAQNLVMNVRMAWYRAFSAQLLRDDVRNTIRIAEEALAESRTAEAQRLRNPVDQLRYQRQVLENLRLLENISQELEAANIELAQLINAPLNQIIPLAEVPARDVGQEIQSIPIEVLENQTLARNPDLREAHYGTRIARDEVRRTLAKLVPNVSLNWGLKYDSDSYLVNGHWQEAGLQVSLNLFNLFTGRTQVRLSEAGASLADQRRLAAHVGALTQMHLARVALMNAREQFVRADAIWDVDRKIAALVRSRQDAQTQSKLDVVSNSTTATLSLLRRYQALGQVQAAESRLLATLGTEVSVNLEPLTVNQATVQVAYQFLGRFEQLIGLEPLPPLKPGAPLPPPARFPVFAPPATDAPR